MFCESFIIYLIVSVISFIVPFYYLPLRLWIIIRGFILLLLIIEIICSRHGDSSSNEDNSGNNKGLHNVGDQEVRVKLGPLLAGGSYI